MIFNTGLLQTPAVPTSTVYVVTAGVCNNPVKYFTDKKCRALAKISQNPASNPPSSGIGLLVLLSQQIATISGHLVEVLSYKLL